MMRLEYLGLMAACLAITLPLEFFLGARVYRRPRRLAAAVLPAAAVFCVWDAVAIARDWWSYDERFVSGLNLPADLPVEELVFFLVLPLCALLSFEAVGRVLTRFGRRSSVRRPRA
jgi:lycopene beta-cyclase